MTKSASIIAASRRPRVAIAIAAALLLICAAASAEAAPVTVAWDANTDGVTAGYRLYYGTSTGNYNVSPAGGIQIVGVNNTSYVVDLTPGQPYFFTVRAYNSLGQLGPASAELSFTLTLSTAHTPAVTNATTTEDTRTNSGLVISRNAADGVEVTHFKVTTITGGTLFQNDGTTAIANNAFITFAQGNAGLKFTPSANSTTMGQFTVQASVSNLDAGLGGGTVTATITVTPVADTPGVTNATANEDTQTTSGLVMSRNAADGVEVTHFKVTAITGGMLFQNDGTTAIANNAFITFAQGNAGLKFTPSANSTTTGQFTVQASLSNLDAGLGGGTATANISVTAVADRPTISAIAPVRIDQGTSTGALAFTVADVETAAASLTVSGISSNTGFVPNAPANIAFGGGGTNRTITVTPAAGQCGALTTITVTVNDGGLSTSTSFKVVCFTDNVLSAGTTPVKRAHIIELRALVDDIRTTSAALTAFAWTDPVISAQSTIVSAQHLRDLRIALGQAYTAMGRTAPTYTDPALDATTSIKLVHFEELRAAAMSLMTPP